MTIFFDFWPLAEPLCIGIGAPETIDKMINNFYSTIKQYMNECIPKYSLCSKSGPPWGNKQLSSLKNSKNKT